MSSTEEIISLFKEITSTSFNDQAVWFLNAHWHHLKDHKDEREDIWNAVQLCLKLNQADDAGDLDEFKAHILLEKLGKAISVTDMRNAIRSAGLVFTKRVSLLEYLIYSYKVDLKDVVTAPQGSLEDDERLTRAADSVQRAQEAMEDCIEQKAIAFTKAKESQQAANEASVKKDEAIKAENKAILTENAALEAKNYAVKEEKKAIKLEAEAEQSEKVALKKEANALKEEKEAVAAENKAVASEQQAVQSESVAHKAEERAVADFAASKAKADELSKMEVELAAALEAQDKATRQAEIELENVKKEEAELADRVEKLRIKSEDRNVGIVSRGTAANELAQLKQTDPLPLQRARVTEDASFRRQQKLSIFAAEKREQASAAKEEAMAYAKKAKAQKEKSIAERAKATAARESAEKERKIAEKEHKEAVEAREEAVQSREVAEAERKAAEIARSKAAQAARKAEEDAKRATDSRTLAEEKRADSEAAAEVATKAKDAALESKKLAEEKAEESIVLFSNAEEHLKKIQKVLSTSGRGKLWFLERTLEENKKYMNPLQLKRLQAQQNLDHAINVA